MRPIDADALKEEINKKRVVGRFNTIQLIDNAPTVDTTCPNCDSGYAQGYSDGYLKGKEERPQGEWISVSERLPEDMQEVLVWFEYYRYGDYNCMYQAYGLCHVLDGKWSPFINGETGWQDARIIAWHPLPEPYKEAENEQTTN